VLRSEEEMAPSVPGYSGSAVAGLCEAGLRAQDSCVLFKANRVNPMTQEGRIPSPDLKTHLKMGHGATVTDIALDQVPLKWVSKRSQLQSVFIEAAGGRLF
jgi:hypothetical protein